MQKRTNLVWFWFWSEGPKQIWEEKSSKLVKIGQNAFGDWLPTVTNGYQRLPNGYRS